MWWRKKSAQRKIEREYGKCIVSDIEQKTKKKDNLTERGRIKGGKEAEIEEEKERGER